MEVDGRHDDGDDEDEEADDHLEDAQPLHRVDAARHQVAAAVHRAAGGGTVWAGWVGASRLAGVQVLVKFSTNHSRVCATNIAITYSAT